MARQKPSYMRISRKLWNETEQKLAQAIEAHISAESQLEQAHNSRDNHAKRANDWQARFNEADTRHIQLLQENARLSTERDQYKNDHDTQAQARHAQKVFYDEQILQLQSEKDQIAKRAFEDHNTINNLTNVNVELRTRLAYFIALTQRIVAPL